MSSCNHCVSGVRHEGTPEGKLELIGDVLSYIATPTVDYPKDTVILYLSDIFGRHLINNQLLADDYARNGFKVVEPDLFDNDPFPHSLMKPGSTLDWSEWLTRHEPASVLPTLRKIIGCLREQGVTKIGVLGFCYGGRLAFDLAFENAVAAVALAHPTFLKVPEDMERYKKESKAPLLINSCELDPKFPKEAQDGTDKILGDGQFAPGYKRLYWPGCAHGFANRGDWSDPQAKAGKEGAFKASVEWFREHL